jgi:hypothetical protein
MKPIEYCLDEILNKLDAYWVDSNNRKFLEGEKMLIDFEMPNRHEFFKSLIDDLIMDGNAVFKDGKKNNDLSHYEQDVLITVRGWYLRANGGYTKAASDKAAFDLNQENDQKAAKLNALILSGGAIVGVLAVIWKGLAFFHQHFCH